MISPDHTMELLSVKSETTDIHGEIVYEYERKKVFCGVKSVTQKEFMEAGKLGLKAQLQFIIRKEMYDGEELAEYKGVVYSIYRSYDAGGDFIELYATLKEGDRDDGG